NGAVMDWWGMLSLGGRRFDGFLFPVTLGIAEAFAAFVRLVERRPRFVAIAALVSLTTVVSTCGAYLTWDAHYGRLGNNFSRDTLTDYTGEAQKVLRDTVWRWGNPLSWPGAWVFAWRTGAPAARYEEVVGNHFLEDFPRAFKRLEPALGFNQRGHEKFLVSGFGPRGKDGYRRVIGSRAR